MTSALASRLGQTVIFGIRPEAITDPDGADRLSRHLVEADCMIEVVEPAGADTFAITHLGGKETVARLRADAKRPPGQSAASPSTSTGPCSSTRRRRC